MWNRLSSQTIPLSLGDLLLTGLDLLFKNYISSSEHRQPKTFYNLHSTHTILSSQGINSVSCRVKTKKAFIIFAKCEIPRKYAKIMILKCRFLQKCSRILKFSRKDTISENFRKNLPKIFVTILAELFFCKNLKIFSGKYTSSKH
jgi:hypothetical protein